MIDFFSLSRDMNFLTSIILHNIGNYNMDKVRDFLNKFNLDINLYFLNAKVISSNDILTMMYAYHLCGLDNRVRVILDSINKNKNVPKKDLTHLVKFILKSKDMCSQSDQTKIMATMNDYMFKKVENFGKATPELLKKGSILTNQIKQTDTEK